MDDEYYIKEQFICDMKELYQYLAETGLSETECSQSEEMLWKSFRKLSPEAMADALHQDNREGRFIYANEDSVYIFGYSLDEVLKSIRLDEIIYLRVVKNFPCSLQTRFNYN